MIDKKVSAAKEVVSVLKHTHFNLERGLARDYLEKLIEDIEYNIKRDEEWLAVQARYMKSIKANKNENT